MNNAIGLIKEDLRRHRVTVTLPGEQEEKSLYLILITAKTKKFKDFVETYGNQVTTTHQKIAQKVFGAEETKNVYGALIDENMRMIFAFNRDFADYDKTKKAIVFKDIDDVLIDRIEVKKIKLEEGEALPIGPKERRGRNPDNIGEWLIRYSLAEKK